MMDKEFEISIKNGDFSKVSNPHLHYSGYNDGIWYACRYGQIEIAKYCIERLHPSRRVRTANGGLRNACGCGQLEAAKLMVELGATELNGGLQHACKHGDMDVIEYLISQGANDWELGLSEACHHGHVDVAKLMIAKGAKKHKVEFGGGESYNNKFMYASQSGNLDMVKLLLELEPASPLQYGMQGACEHGKLDVMKYLVSLGATHLSEYSLGLIRGPEKTDMILYIYTHLPHLRRTLLNLHGRRFRKFKSTLRIYLGKILPPDIAARLVDAAYES